MQERTCKIMDRNTKRLSAWLAEENLQQAAESYSNEQRLKHPDQFKT